MYMVEEFLESLVSDATRKSYKRGIKKFEEFDGMCSGCFEYWQNELDLEAEEK